jgi:anhydro-N-acetylmuramic acid kinase
MEASLKRTLYVIGLMSGTSLDGLDMAFCTFRLKDDGDWIFKIVAADCIEYDAVWKDKLNNAPLLNGHELVLLHKEYGNYIGAQVNAFVKAHNIKADFIASHGHTVFHEPGKMFTFQLGDGAALHATTGLPVVCDFRSVDVSLGGQGAPLVPVGDVMLFKDFSYCLNLGGIANISMKSADGRIAYDICGCNLLLNHSAKLKGKDFDENGALARLGKINPELRNALNDWDYYKMLPPKSLDKETMLSQLIPLIDKFQLSPEDILSTLCDHIASRVADAVQTGSGPMLITGGGAFNAFLMDRIREKCSIPIIIPGKELVQYKEALIFAFLGVLRARNEVNSYASVTGASENNIGGAVYGPLDLYDVKPDTIRGKITFILMFLGFLLFVFALSYISLRMAAQHIRQDRIELRIRDK